MFGGWFTSASPNDNNFLRVANTFTSRRLSDNTLMTPKIRIAPSCASSPGGTPGSGLPIRRHSSTGPQERRGSNINLSPPTVHIYIFHMYTCTDVFQLLDSHFYVQITLSLCFFRLFFNSYFFFIKNWSFIHNILTWMLFANIYFSGRNSYMYLQAGSLHSLCLCHIISDIDSFYGIIFVQTRIIIVRCR